MAKEVVKKDDRHIYEVVVECWIKGELHRVGEQLKLTDAEAREWLERRYIKLIK